MHRILPSRASRPRTVTSRNRRTLTRTLGVDLASLPKKTAACIIEWGHDSVTVAAPVLGLTNRDIVALADDCQAIGIDSPFGWPLPFVDFLKQAHAPCRGRTFIDSTDPMYLRALRYRRTDLHVWQKHNLVPLAVAADKIAMPAMRCVELLDLLRVTDRSGDDRVWEVYPAVALKDWGFDAKGYKSREGNPPLGEQVRARLLEAMCLACPWLRLTIEPDSPFVRSAHAFEALIASRVTRAAYLDRTERPTDDEVEIAKLEGWIAVPDKDCLGTLHDFRAT